jgi:hypothetical protein
MAPLKKQRKKPNRIVKPEPPQPRTRGIPDEYCDALIAASVEICAERDMVETARTELKSSAECDIFSVDNVRGEFFIANSGGHRFAAAAAEKDGLEVRVGALEGRVFLLEGQVQDQQGRINLLENSVVKDRNFRHRFISTFKRDKLGNATEADHDLIRAVIV